MPAGTAAIPVVSEHLHRVDDALPYRPRALSRSERNRREIFVYFSPKNHRIVTIADAPNMALAIQLEFDPTVARYVERPKRLSLGAKTDIDLSFWTQSTSNEERIHLLIPETGLTGSTSGATSIRDRTALEAAARNASITLNFVSERELHAARTWLATGIELLQWVWLYRRLVGRSVIRQEIVTRLADVSRVSLSGLIQHSPHNPAHVRAVVAGMVHEGALQLVDYVPGAVDAILERRHA
jgi:hypothetical protein